MVALRLPSELAGLATVAVVYLFCRFVLSRRFVALAAALILISSTLFFGTHVAMSGDCYALLSLFTTLCTLAFFYFAESLRPRTTPAPDSPGMLFGLLAVFALRRTRQTATQGGPADKKHRSQAAAGCCVTTALVLLAVISASQTRLLYYCAPASPLLSIAAAIGGGNSSSCPPPGSQTHPGFLISRPRSSCCFSAG